jgi:hypothetical protein
LKAAILFGASFLFLNYCESQTLPPFIDDKVAYFEWAKPHPKALYVADRNLTHENLRELLVQADKGEIVRRFIPLLGKGNEKTPSYMRVGIPLFILAADVPLLAEDESRALAELSRFVNSDDYQGENGELNTAKSRFLYLFDYIGYILPPGIERDVFLKRFGKILGKLKIDWTPIETYLFNMSATDDSEKSLALLQEILTETKGEAYLTEWRARTTERIITDVNLALSEEPRKESAQSKLSRLMGQRSSPQVISFLKIVLQDPSRFLCREGLVQGLLLAFATRDAELQTKVREFFASELSGKTEWLGKSKVCQSTMERDLFPKSEARFHSEQKELDEIEKLRAELKLSAATPSSRQNLVFDSLADMFFVTHLNNEYEMVLSELMLELKFDDTLVFKRLEFCARVQNSLMNVCRNYLNTVKGPAFLSEMAVTNAARARRAFLDSLNNMSGDISIRASIFRHLGQWNLYVNDKEVVEAMRKAILDEKNAELSHLRFLCVMGLNIPELREMSVEHLRKITKTPTEVLYLFNIVKTANIQQNLPQFLQSLYSELGVQDPMLLAAALKDHSFYPFLSEGLRTQEPTKEIKSEADRLVEILRKGFEQCDKVEENATLNIAEFTNSIRPFFTLVYAPATKDFIRQHLIKSIDCRDRRMLGIMIIGSYVSEDKQLIEDMRKIIGEYVGGEISEYAQTEKLIRILTGVQTTLFQNPAFASSSDDFENTMVEAYPLTPGAEDEIKAVARARNPSLYRSFAQKYLIKHYGKEALDTLLATPWKIHSTHVNGGFSFTSNLKVQEHDLNSFNHGLYLGEATLFSGGGPDAKVVVPKRQGLLDLGPAGVIERIKTTIKENFEIASLANIVAHFAKLALGDWDQIEVSYGGHGDDNGLATWGGEYLTANMLAKMYAAFNPKTRIQSIFLQCFGGATIVPPKRPIQTEISSFYDYADRYYPANRCAFSLSAHDELGYFYSGTEDMDWKEDSWGKLFKSVSIHSLQEIKNFLLQDDMSAATAVTTSDYFEQDLRQTLCNEVSTYDAFVKKNGDDNSKWSLEARLEYSQLSPGLDADPKIRTEIDRLCSSPEAKKLFEVAAESLDYVNSHFHLLKLIEGRFTKEFLATNYPRQTEENQAALNKIAELNIMEDYKHSRSTAIKKAQVLQLNHELTEEYQLLFASVPRNKDNMDYYNQKFRDYFTANPELISKLPIALNLVGSKEKDIHLFELASSQILAHLREIQENRKKLEKVVRPFIRSEIERILEAPSLAPLKARYSSIRSCERAPL